MGQVQVRRDGHATWCLEMCADATRNALSSSLVTELASVIDDAASQDVRVVALVSSGPAFSSGFDLTEPLETDGDALRRFSAIGALLEMLKRVPFVTVAFVDGPAYGAGADLAIACDYRFATSAARFRFPGPRFGLVLGLERLCDVVGTEAARDLALRGRVVGSAEARASGLVSEIVGAEDWPHELRKLTQAVCELDQITVAAILEATRGRCSGDAARLALSAARPGIVGRIGAFAAAAKA